MYKAPYCNNHNHTSKYKYGQSFDKHLGSSATNQKLVNSENSENAITKC